ncbi:MAG TPA: CDP-alcohol phosphatidyltransferase family protein [Gemmatimonadaceae bacterium]
MRAFASRTPIALTALRAALGPVVVLMALVWPNAAAFAVCLTLAFLSDYFDGVIARRLGVATAPLRRLDSIADTVFYLSALFAAWHLRSDILHPYVPALLALGTLEVARYAFDFLKFGREASYHMWSSKLWGITLVVAFFALLVYGRVGWPVALAIYAGIAADLEGLAISSVLREWRTDVRTIFHALELRAEA